MQQSFRSIENSSTHGDHAASDTWRNDPRRFRLGKNYLDEHFRGHHDKSQPAEAVVVETDNDYFDDSAANRVDLRPGEELEERKSNASLRDPSTMELMTVSPATARPLPSSAKASVSLFLDNLEAAVAAERSVRETDGRMPPHCSAHRKEKLAMAVADAIHTVVEATSSLAASPELAAEIIHWGGSKSGTKAFELILGTLVTFSSIKHGPKRDESTYVAIMDACGACLAALVEAAFDQFDEYTQSDFLKRGIEGCRLSLEAAIDALPAAFLKQCEGTKFLTGRATRDVEVLSRIPAGVLHFLSVLLPRLKHKSASVQSLHPLARKDESGLDHPNCGRILSILSKVLQLFDLSFLSVAANPKNQRSSTPPALGRVLNSGDSLRKTSTRRRHENESNKFSQPLLFDELLKTSRAANPSARKPYENDVDPQEAMLSLPVKFEAIDKWVPSRTESNSAVLDLSLNRQMVLRVVIPSLIAAYSLSFNQSRIAACLVVGLDDHSKRGSGIIRPLTKLLALQGRQIWKEISASFVRQKACILLLQLIGISEEVTENFMANISGIGSLVDVLVEFPEDQEIGHLSKAVIESLENRGALRSNESAKTLLSILYQRARSAQKANDVTSEKIEYRLGYAALESKSNKCVARPQSAGEDKYRRTNGDQPQIQCDQSVSDEGGKSSQVKVTLPESNLSTGRRSGLVEPNKFNCSRKDREVKSMTGYAESKKYFVHLATQEVLGLEKQELEADVRRLRVESLHRARVFPPQHGVGPNTRGVSRRRPASAQTSRGDNKLKPLRPTSATSAVVENTEVQDIRKHIPGWMKAKGEKGQIPLSVVRRLRKEKVDRVRSGASVSSQDRDNVLVSDLNAVRSHFRSRNIARENTGGAGALKTQGLPKAYRKKAPPIEFNEDSLYLSDEEQEFIPSPEAPARLGLIPIESQAERPLLLAHSDHVQRIEEVRVGFDNVCTSRRLLQEVPPRTTGSEEFQRQDETSELPTTCASNAAATSKTPGAAVVCSEEAQYLILDMAPVTKYSPNNESIKNRLLNMACLSRDECEVLLTDLVELARDEEGNKERDENILKEDAEELESARGSISHVLQSTAATSGALASTLDSAMMNPSEIVTTSNCPVIEDRQSGESIKNRLLNLKRLSSHEKKLLLSDLAKLARDKDDLEGNGRSTAQVAAQKSNRTTRGIEYNPGSAATTPSLELLGVRLLNLRKLTKEQKLELLSDFSKKAKNTQSRQPCAKTIKADAANIASANTAPYSISPTTGLALSALESRLLCLSRLNKLEKLALLDECAQEIRRSENLESPASQRIVLKNPHVVSDVTLESRLRGLDGLSIKDRLKLVDDFALEARRVDNSSNKVNAKSLPAPQQSTDRVRALPYRSEERAAAVPVDSRECQREMLGADSVTTKHNVQNIHRCSNDDGMRTGYETAPHSSSLPQTKESEISPAKAVMTTESQVLSLEYRLLRLDSLSRHEKHELLRDLAEGAHQETWKMLEHKLARLSHLSKSDKLLLLWEIAHEFRRSKHTKEPLAIPSPEVHEEAADVTVVKEIVDTTLGEISSRLLSLNALSMEERMHLLADCATEARIDALVKTLNKSGDGAVSKADFKREFHNPSNSDIEDQLYSIFGLSGVISDNYAIEILDAVFECMDEHKRGRVTHKEIREFVLDVDYFMDIWETSRGTASLASPTQEWIDELDVEWDETLSHNTVIFGFKDHPELRTLARSRRQTGAPSKNRTRKLHAKSGSSVSSIPALPVQSSRSPSPSLEATALTPEDEKDVIPEPSALLRSATSFDRLSDVDKALPTVALNLETRLQHLDSLSTSEKMALLEDLAREAKLMDGYPEEALAPKPAEASKSEEGSRNESERPKVTPPTESRTTFRSDVAMITLGTFTAEAARMSIEERLLRLSSLPQDTKYKLLADLVTLAQHAVTDNEPSNDGALDDATDSLAVQASGGLQEDKEVMTKLIPAEADLISVEERLLNLSSLPQDAKHELLTDLVTLVQQAAATNEPPGDTSDTKSELITDTASDRVQEVAEVAMESVPADAVSTSIEDRLFNLSNLPRDAKHKLLIDLVTLAHHAAEIKELSVNESYEGTEALAVQTSDRAHKEREVLMESNSAEAAAMSIARRLFNLPGLPQDAKHKLLADLVTLARLSTTTKELSGENIAKETGHVVCIEERLLQLASLAQDAKHKLLADLVTLAQHAAATKSTSGSVLAESTDNVSTSVASKPAAAASESIVNHASVNTAIVIDQVGAASAIECDCNVGTISADSTAADVVVGNVSTSPDVSASTSGTTDAKEEFINETKEVLKDTVPADIACGEVSTPPENLMEMSSNLSDPGGLTADVVADQYTNPGVDLNTASTLATTVSTGDAVATAAVTSASPDNSASLSTSDTNAKIDAHADAALTAAPSLLSKPAPSDPPTAEIQNDKKQAPTSATGSTTTTARVLSAFSALPSMALGGASTNGSKLKQAARRAREAAAAHQAKVDMVRVKATQRQAERDQQELAEMIQGVAQAHCKKDSQTKEIQAEEETANTDVNDKAAVDSTKRAVLMIQRAVLMIQRDKRSPH